MTIPTVNAAFDELLKRIELNPTRAQLASGRYESIKKTLEAGIPGCEVFQIGSFQRKTKIRPAEENEGLDIDVAVCLKAFTEFAAPGQGVDPIQALTTVKKALEKDKTYKMMDPEKDAPTVVLEYGDGFKAEIVPCYRSVGRHYQRRNPPHCYIVGDKNNSWQPADYDYDADIISGLNQIETVRRSLVPSVKMIKQFLRNCSSPLKSFHVEILCATLIPSAIIFWETSHNTWHYKHVLAFFLSNAHKNLNGAAKLTGSYSVPVDSGLNIHQMMQLGVALKKLGDTAWALCKLTDGADSLRLWTEYYGDPFPTS